MAALYQPALSGVKPRPEASRIQEMVGLPGPRGGAVEIGRSAQKKGPPGLPEAPGLPDALFFV